MTEPEHQDVVSAFRAYQCNSSITWDAYQFTKPPYLSMFGEVRVQEWSAPTDDDLRDYLLSRWPVEKVDGFFADRARRAAVQEAREKWEATFRGRATLRYRAIRHEIRERVRESWKILRHGVEEEY